MKAVLFINLGTPKSTKKSAVARYLYQFLTDRRVIDIPALYRYILVLFCILPSRTKGASERYKAIWTPEGSPLMAHSTNFLQKIAPILEKKGVDSYLAMRYQEPSISSVMKEIQKNMPEELLIFPLYPQYASATSGSSLEACFKELQNWPYIPEIKTISSYAHEPWFQKVWIKKIQKEQLPNSHLLFCFHGLPKRQLLRTNPTKNCFQTGCCSNPKSEKSCYVAQCKLLGEALANKLAIKASEWSIAFQSRLGTDEWTKPYLIDHLVELRSQHVTRISIVALSFVTDCIETIEELNIEARDIFLQNGGKAFHTISSLNDDNFWIEQCATYVQTHLFGDREL